jgi:hypothetical protein
VGVHQPQQADRRYLTALIGWGFKPSHVERLILAQPETEPDQDGDSEPDQDGGSEPDQDGDTVPVQDEEDAGDV